MPARAIVIERESHGWAWFWIRASRSGRVRVQGVLGGVRLDFRFRVLPAAVRLLVLKLQYEVGEAEQEQGPRGTLRLGWGPGAYSEAMRVLMFLVASYRLRGEKRLERLADCIRGLTGLEPGFSDLTSLFLAMLPKPETPRKMRPRALTRAARIIRAYCGI